MLSTDTCTLSRVMQTCSEMSMAVSFSECCTNAADEREKNMKPGVQRREILAELLAA